MARVELTDDAYADLKDLDGSVRTVVLKALKKLEVDPHLRGAALGSRPRGNLTGFRKLVIGDRDYRAVYRVEEDGAVAVVSVIARRADDEAYELAIARLRLSADASMKALADQLTQILE